MWCHGRTRERANIIIQQSGLLRRRKRAGGLACSRSSTRVRSPRKHHSHPLEAPVARPARRQPPERRSLEGWRCTCRCTVARLGSRAVRAAILSGVGCSACACRPSDRDDDRREFLRSRLRLRVCRLRRLRRLGRRELVRRARWPGASWRGARACMRGCTCAAAARRLRDRARSRTCSPPLWGACLLAVDAAQPQRLLPLCAGLGVRARCRGCTLGRRLYLGKDASPPLRVARSALRIAFGCACATTSARALARKCAHARAGVHVSARVPLRALAQAAQPTLRHSHLAFLAPPRLSFRALAQRLARRALRLQPPSWAHRDAGRAQLSLCDARHVVWLEHAE